MEPFYSTIDHTIGDEIKNDESNRLFAVIQASGTQFKVAKVFYNHIVFLFFGDYPLFIGRSFSYR